MVNQSFLISNINTVKDTFSINAKVVRMWRQCNRTEKKNRRMVVEMTNIEGLKLKCTWDALIDDFKTKMESSSDHIKVSVFQFGSVHKYRESVSVSNTFYSSHFFINEEIPKIDDFRSRLLARVGDDTSSLQVSNLTSE
ncbi:hypothetical protein Tco_0027326 [Tanacetum coccineum]